MKRVGLTSVLVFCFGLFGFSQKIDEAKSQVGFKISNMGVNTVKGTFGGMKGKAVFDPNNYEVAVFDVCIDAKTINTGNKKRDEDLRKEPYFDVGNYSTICFKSISVQQKGATYEVKGELTMRGITREVQVPFSFSKEELKGDLVVNRLDYNIGGKNTFVVGNEVEIEIVLVIKK